MIFVYFNGPLRRIFTLKAPPILKIIQAVSFEIDFFFVSLSFWRKQLTVCYMVSLLFQSKQLDISFKQFTHICDWKDDCHLFYHTTNWSRFYVMRLWPDFRDVLNSEVCCMTLLSDKYICSHLLECTLCVNLWSVILICVFLVVVIILDR